MSSKRVALLLAALFCFVAIAPSALFAQSASTGTVAGTVTDPSGGAIVGATVTLTDTATSIARTDATNESGRYFFANVVPSKYTVSVNKTGFRVSKLVDQIVNIGASLTLNLTLEVGSVAETVEVTATSGADLQTLNATVGNTVGGALLQDLPSIQRDATTFVTLQPGVSPDGSVAGAVVDQSTFMLDGGQNTNDMDGSMQVYTPSFAGDPTGGIVSSQVGGSPTGVMPTPLDSVEEFKVNTANQTADFNSSAGAQVQVVTKRGTNAWHGSAYEYYFDNNFNANTWQNNLGDPTNNNKPFPEPSYHYNRFGASGGGPIIKKDILGGKTYFFANYEGFRWNNSQQFEVPVPSADMRNGILHLDVCDAACQVPNGPAPVPTTFKYSRVPTAAQPELLLAIPEASVLIPWSSKCGTPMSPSGMTRAARLLAPAHAAMALTKSGLRATSRFPIPPISEWLAWITTSAQSSTSIAATAITSWFAPPPAKSTSAVSSQATRWVHRRLSPCALSSRGFLWLV